MAASSEVIVKVDYDNDLRRFMVDAQTTWSDFLSILRSLYGFSQSQLDKLLVHYKDDEGDTVIASSSSELLEALQLAVISSQVLRLKVSFRTSAQPSLSSSSISPTHSVSDSDYKQAAAEEVVETLNDNQPCETLSILPSSSSEQNSASDGDLIPPDSGQDVEAESSNEQLDCLPLDVPSSQDSNDSLPAEVPVLDSSQTQLIFNALRTVLCSNHATQLLSSELQFLMQLKSEVQASHLSKLISEHALDLAAEIVSALQCDFSSSSTVAESYTQTDDFNVTSGPLSVPSSVSLSPSPSASPPLSPALDSTGINEPPTTPCASPHSSSITQSILHEQGEDVTDNGHVRMMYVQAGDEYVLVTRQRASTTFSALLEKQSLSRVECRPMAASEPALSLQPPVGINKSFRPAVIAVPEHPLAMQSSIPDITAIAPPLRQITDRSDSLTFSGLSDLTLSEVMGRDESRPASPLSSPRKLHTNNTILVTDVPESTDERDTPAIAATFALAESQISICLETDKVVEEECVESNDIYASCIPSTHFAATGRSVHSEHSDDSESDFESDQEEVDDGSNASVMYATELKQLRDMGFKNIQVNQQLLLKYQGVVEKVVCELMSAS
eukprot:GILJ01007272.1.p1 GENE.GILJ01007272.1~~GILJ01007272.1.p1  ORF type:complete len:614 (+),score=108.55 GILJ01007272.1:329-2170(+)